MRKKAHNLENKASRGGRRENQSTDEFLGSRNATIAYRHELEFTEPEGEAAGLIKTREIESGVEEVRGMGLIVVPHFVATKYHDHMRVDIMAEMACVGFPNIANDVIESVVRV